MKIRKFTLAVIFGSFLLLGVLGNTLVMDSSITEKVVLASCEDDECELGHLCQDNPNGNTGCSMDGGECTTYGCKEEGD